MLGWRGRGEAGRIPSGRTRHPSLGVPGRYATHGAQGAQGQGEEKLEWMKCSFFEKWNHLADA